jgi:hypothetical protein
MKEKHQRREFCFILLPSSLPFDGTFFRRVDLGLFCSGQRFAKQKPFDVVEEEVLRVRAGEIQAVVIDDLGLLLEPTGPARLTYLSGDSLSEFVWKRRKANRGSLFATVFAFNIFAHY